MARKGIYPPSVKPGIPRLAECPMGWETVRFKDILDVAERKADIKDKKEYQLVIAKRNRGGIEPRTVLLGKQIATKTQQYIKTGDFLISRRQIIHGACGIVPSNLDGALVSNEYVLLTAKNDFLKEYLTYFSHTTYFQQTCFHSSVGVDVEKMVFRLDKWLNNRFHLPPFQIQSKIVEILACWEKEIDQLIKIIQLKQQLKKSLTQQLLAGRIRFPEFGNSIKQNNVLPQEWKIVRIKDIAQVYFSGIDKKSHKDEIKIKLCNYLDVYKNEYITSDLNFMEATASEAECKSFQLHKGDVLITKDSETPDDIGIPAVVIDQIPNVLCGYHLALIRPDKSEINSIFLSKILSTNQIKKHFSRHANGATRFGLSNSAVNNTTIHLPSMKEQQKIGSFLFSIDHQISLLQNKVKFLSHQKNGLMIKLLSGEVRVNFKKGEYQL